MAAIGWRYKSEEEFDPVWIKQDRVSSSHLYFNLWDEHSVFGNIRLHLVKMVCRRARSYVVWRDGGAHDDENHTAPWQKLPEKITDCFYEAPLPP